jgi:ribosomal protein S18 acetylase RimI-like enzyme
MERSRNEPVDLIKDLVLAKQSNKGDCMEIIKANISHIKIAAKLFDLYRMFYGQSSDIKGAEGFLKERISGKESIIFLAFDGENAIGFMQLYPSFSSVSMQRIIILNDLYIDEKWRGRGVGKALIKEAEKIALENGIKKITLSTAQDNVKAQKLYEAEGFLKGGFFNYFKEIA